MRGILTLHLLAGLIGGFDCALAEKEQPAVTQVRFELINHLIIVRGSVGGIPNLRFVLDTGASVSVLPPRLAKRLGLTFTGGSVDVLGRTVPVKRSLLDELWIGDRCFRPVPVRVARLPSLHDASIDGLIGLDLLRRTPVTIDYSTRTVTFGEIGPLPKSISFYPHRNIIVLRMWLHDQPATMMLDTGMGDLILHRPEVESLLPEVRFGPPGRIRTAAGNLRVRRIFLKSVSLAESKWQQVAALLLNGPQPDGVPVTGCLGPLALGMKRIQVDFANRRFRWE